MKKKTITTVLVIMLLTFSVFAAAIIGTLTYWYSDGSSIGYWTTARKINLNADSSASTTAAQNAATQWTNAGISSSWVASGQNIVMFSYPYATCVQLNSSISTEDAGFTVTYQSYVGDFDYNSTYKRGYEIVLANVYVITDASTNFIGGSAHELGHAFGWQGHSSNSSDVMYPYNNTPTTLTTRDKNQLNQVY